jgi:class 3 adenylate cyclase
MMNTHLFLQKLEALKKRPEGYLPAIEAIQHWVLEFADTLPKQRISPVKVAMYANLSVVQVIPEFLHGVLGGIFDLNWEVHCPHCFGISDNYQHLSKAVSQSFCKGCEKEFQADFAQWVDVTFSLNKEIDDRKFTPECTQHLSSAPKPPHLSGLELIHHPAFRTLFGDQVLSEREQMQIASVTTLFTDITGSTSMYEKLGDVRAYNIVRDHFDILFEEIEKQGGTVLKTIGDAVMASFIRNDLALNAIIDALEQFKQYNKTRRIDEHVYIKTGIHRGSAILVNLNERLDYFGSTINKAARIQAIASSGEICFSEQVYQDNAFMQTLKKRAIKEITRHSVNLKGIDGAQTVYKVVTYLDKMML